MAGLDLVFIIIIFLFSVIVHEVCHGLAADAMGDPTPRMAGRLTLNPLPHLDPIGSFLVPFFLIIMGSGFVFGWAKPVPVNPYNFRDQKYGELKVGAAGICANFVLAIIFGLPIRFLPQNINFFQNLTTFFSYVVFINLLLGIFNLFPFPPFDGYHIFSTFIPQLKKLEAIAAIQVFSIVGAIIFLLFIGQYIIFFLFRIITGGGIPFL